MNYDLCPSCFNDISDEDHYACSAYRFINRMMCKGYNCKYYNKEVKTVEEMPEDELQVHLC